MTDLPKLSSSRVPRRPRRILLAMDHYMRAVHKGAADYARQAGWLIDVRPSHLPQLPPDWNGDGIITFVGSSDYFGPAVRAAGVPIVNTSPYGAQFQLPSVQLDNRKIGSVAANHLIDLGFRHLCMIQFLPSSLTSEARRRGFAAEAAARRADFLALIPPLHIEYTGALAPHMLEWIPAALAQAPKPLGILTEGDAVAVEIIQMLVDTGLSVPQDFAVLGVDNDEMVVETSPVTASSVDSNLYGLGMQAAQLLHRILNGEPAPAEPILVAPRGVVQRQSTNVLAFSSEEVVTAVAFIRDHFREPITLADVVQAVSISRRRLQDLFQEQTGRSILEEINRCRVELAKRMLTESQLPISQIAEMCGLVSGPQISKVFLREANISPSDYRQQNKPPTPLDW